MKTKEIKLLQITQIETIMCYSSERRKDIKFRKASEEIRKKRWFRSDKIEHPFSVDGYYSIENSEYPCLDGYIPTEYYKLWTPEILEEEDMKLIDGEVWTKDKIIIIGTKNEATTSFNSYKELETYLEELLNELEGKSLMSIVKGGTKNEIF